jgi:hypothetical protein
MNRRKTFALTLSMLAAISTAGAQAPATQPPASSAQVPAPAASAPRLEMTPPARANREPPVTADARGCLELPSNDAIIRCAEKYLPHRRSG